MFVRMMMNRKMKTKKRMKMTLELNVLSASLMSRTLSCFPVDISVCVQAAVTTKILWKFNDFQLSVSCVFSVAADLRYQSSNCPICRAREPLLALKYSSLIQSPLLSLLFTRSFTCLLAHSLVHSLSSSHAQLRIQHSEQSSK